MTETRSNKVHDRKGVRPILIASPRTVGEHMAPLRRLLVGLADESIVPVLICPCGADRERIASAPAQVFTYPIVDLPLMNWLGFDTLVSQLERLKPTIVHCLCETRVSLACRLAQALDVPCIQVVNTLATGRHFSGIASSQCDAIVAPTETIAASVSKAHPRLADRVHQINTGAFVTPEPVCFSHADHVPSVVVAQPIRSVSGYSCLFGAIKGLFDEGCEFLTVVIGGGRLERPLRRMMTDQGLDQVATMIPPMDPWRPVLAAADIFVQPQACMAFSVCLMEAMSVGAAVVACRGGVDDLIVHNETALAFDSEDEQSVKQTLRRCLDDSDSARQLARRAQSFLKKYYSTSAMVSATLEMYARLQREHSHRSTASAQTAARS